MLEKYIKEVYKSKSAFAKKIGISRQRLEYILKIKSKDISAYTAMRIFEETGLSIKDYLEV